MRPQRIKNFEELINIEDEVYKHVLALDTGLARMYVEKTYADTAILFISDMALHHRFVEIPRDEIEKDEHLKNHLKWHYWGANEWL